MSYIYISTPRRTERRFTAEFRRTVYYFLLYSGTRTIMCKHIRIAIHAHAYNNRWVHTLHINIRSMLTVAKFRVVITSAMSKRKTRWKNNNKKTNKKRQRFNTTTILFRYYIIIIIITLDIIIIVYLCDFYITYYCKHTLSRS